MASRLPVGTWILCFIVVCGMAGSAHAVDRLVPQEYPTIQEGINAAQTGDIVLVSPGVYNELIDFLGKTITVRSTDGPAVTIIDGGGSGPIVTFQNLEGPGSVLEGFTITNGVAAEGAGITILDAYPTILNNTISSNTATAGPGGGIMMRNYTPNIDTTLIPNFSGNIIDGNIAWFGGGGVYVYTAYDPPEILGNQINGNTLIQGQGGAGVILNSLPGGGGLNLGFGEFGATSRIRNNQISLNQTDNGASGIRLIGSGFFDVSINDLDANIVTANSWDPQIEIYNTTTFSKNGGSVNFSGNSLSNGNGILFYGVRDVSISDTIIDAPDAYFGVYSIYSESVTISESNLNTSSRSVYASYSDSVTVSKSTLNSSWNSIAAYRINDLEINDSIIDSDSGTNAIYSYYHYGTVEVNGNTITGDLYGYSYADPGDYLVRNNSFSTSDINLGGTFNYPGTTKTKIQFSNNSLENSGVLIDFRDAYSDPNDFTSIEVDLSNNIFLDSGVLQVLSWGRLSDITQINISDLVFSNTIFSSQDFLEIDLNSYYTSSDISIDLNNVLVDGLSGSGNPISIIVPTDSTSDISLDQVTAIADSATSAVSISMPDAANSSVNVTNSILRGSEGLAVSAPTSSEISMQFSNISGGPTDPSLGLIDEEPVFVSGPLGNHYLSQIKAGDLIDSPGVDAGNPDTAASFLSGTRADGGLDTGIRDLGYHYPSQTEDSLVQLDFDDAAIFFEPGTGLLDSEMISMYLNETVTEGNAPTPWRGISLRLLQESESLQIATVDIADDLLTTLGSPPEYFEALVCDDVVTIGLIASLSDPNLTFTISPSTEIFQLGLAAGPTLANTNEIVETQWIPQDGIGCGGLFDVTNVVSDTSGNITPIQRRPLRLTLVPRPLFLRGDANTDGQTDLGDAVALLSFLFNSLGQLYCHDSADVNDDGQIDVADPVSLLSALFTAGPAPPSPSQSCGPDPTADFLRCESYEVCTPLISINSFSATTAEPGLVQMSWVTSGPVDQFLVFNNGIIHQRLAGTATGSEIRSLPSGLQEVCLWVLAEGQIVEECLSVITSQPVTNLTCQMDAQSPDAILEWIPLAEVHQLEIYSGNNLLAVVNSADLTAQIAIPQTGISDLCLIGVTEQAVSSPICCQVQTNDECYGALPLELGNNSLSFQASTYNISTPYDDGQCLSCWDSDPFPFIIPGYGGWYGTFSDVWYSYTVNQAGVMYFNYSNRLAIYDGNCSALNQKYCGSDVMRQVEVGDQFLIRLNGFKGSNPNFSIGYVDNLPQPQWTCSQGFDPISGLRRVSWGISNRNFFEWMTITVDGVEVGTIPGTDGTFLIPSLVSGSTYEICLIGQTGSLVSPPACQTVTIP